MILYRKATHLRIRQATAPEPPFWCASTVAPYSARRAVPVAVDYVTLRASGSARLEVIVCDDVRDELERSRELSGPLLIDATESAETIFRRGEDALGYCEEQGLATVFLTSTSGTLPVRSHPRSSIAIAAWPLDIRRLDGLFGAASDMGLPWGVVIPVIFPVTTDLEPLDDLAIRAAARGASFLAAIAIESDATARQAIANSLDLGSGDDRYAMLFHADVEPVQVATERHIAAIAAERGLAGFATVPEWNERTNWNASALLTLTASRMIAMELDLDLAGLIARSARIVVELDKPLERIAAAASLSIVGGLDEVSVEMLTEWLATGRASFADYVDQQWRLRRV